jgi:OST3 / OST6 family, transporter family
VLAALYASTIINRDVYSNFEKAVKLYKSDSSAERVHFGVMLHDVRNAKVFEGIDLKTTPAIAVFNFPPIHQKASLKGNIYLINSDIDYSVGAVLNFVNARTNLKIKEKMNMMDVIVLIFMICLLGTIFYYLLKYKQSLVETLEYLQKQIKKRELWIFVSSCIFVIFMGCIIFVTLHGAPAFGQSDDIIEILINKQNRFQYGIEGFIASGLMLSSGLMLVALVMVLRNKDLKGNKKCTTGALVLLLFCVLYYLLIQMYTYKTPWHHTQDIYPPSSYIKGPITADHGMTI